jgi:predicted DNA-binding transcriptional regulator AlpA
MSGRNSNPPRTPASKTAVHIAGMTRTRPVTKLHTVDEDADLSQLSEGSTMTQQNIATSKITTGFERLLTSRDAASFLRLSQSWLAKARMRGDGPPYVKIGRSIRYRETALVQWLKSKQRLSTTKQ